MQPSIPPELVEVLEADPETLSGAVRFRGTRVPVQALVDTLDCGLTVDDFLDGWPNVPRSSAETVIRWQQSSSRVVFGLDPTG